MKITPEQLIGKIRKKDFSPVYFLFGEEPYFIDFVTDQILKYALTEEEKAFNLHVFYGKDSTVPVIADTARRFPMMAERQVVLVREAQQLTDLDKITPYLSAPQVTTILIIQYKHKKPDKRKKVFQEFDRHTVMMESERIRDNKLPDWIIRQGNQKGITIDIKSANLLAESLGSDLEKILSELDKMLLVLPEGNKTLTPELIEQYIGVSKEFNHFELNKALSARDMLKATQIILYFCKNPNAYPLQVTLSRLFFYYTKILSFHAVKNKSRDIIARQLKIHPYFINEYQQAAKYYTPARLEKAFSVLRDMDMKSKGVGNTLASHCDLLKEMTYKLLNL